MKNVTIFFLLTIILTVSSQEDIISTIVGNLNIDEICAWIRDQQFDDVCFKQLKVVCGNDTFRNIMLDASSKFPYTGMLVRSRIDFGSYDECIQLDLVSNNTRVLGKHCFSSLVIPTTSVFAPDVVDKAYKLSTCLPDQCPAKYLLELANLSYIYPLFNDNSCSTKYHKPFEWCDYIVIIYFSLIFAVLITSTAYDLYHQYISKDVPNKMMQMFSFYYNGRKLFKVSAPSKDQIQAIHGLRVISMMWIVLGHAFQFQLYIPITYERFINDFMLDWKSFYVTTAYLSVDTFFFISGLLLAYQYFKTEFRTLKTYFLKVPQLILHRYIRLTPVVASTYILVVTLSKYMGNGPMYQTLIESEIDSCLKNWWSFFLYVQNYANYSDLCIAHTWYLSADWQLFLVSLLVIIPMTEMAKRNCKWIMLTMLVFNVGSILVPALVKYIYEDYDNEYETHMRLNSYFIGFMLGAYLRTRDSIKHRLSKQKNLVIWSCVIGLLLSDTFLFKKIQLLTLENNDFSYRIYTIPVRALWAVCLAWIVYACHFGYGGFINKFLTTPMVQILSKLTFCLYMTHGILDNYMVATSRSLLEAGQFSGIKDSIMIYPLAVIVSTVMSLAFESPFIALEAFILRKK